jgi:hypothetical protein
MHTVTGGGGTSAAARPRLPQAPGVTYPVWMILVDSVMLAAVGVDSTSLPTLPWARWFDQGLTHTQAAYRGVVRHAAKPVKLLGR